MTIDPERDTAEILTSYVGIRSGVVGLRGDAEQTRARAKEFKVFFEKVPGKSPGSYTVDHTAASFVFDPQGRLRLYVGNGQGPDVFAHDIRELLHAQG